MSHAFVESFDRDGGVFVEDGDAGDVGGVFVEDDETPRLPISQHFPGRTPLLPPPNRLIKN